jgi:hypothetical protein
MRTTYTYLFFLSFLLLSSSLTAQNSVTSLPLIRTLPQASGLNPGMLPEYKFALGLPGIGGIHSSTDINFMNLSTLLSADAEQIYNRLARTSRLTNYQEVSLFHLGIRTQKSHTAFSIDTKTFSRFTFPRDLIGMVLLGNDHEKLAGQDVSLNNLSFVARAHTEFALTHGREILDGLNVGVRLKYLMGHFDASLPGIDATLRANIDEVSFTANQFDVRTAGIAPFLSEDEVDYVNLALSPNSGFGIDVGAEYRLLKRLNLFASVIDMGFINWSNNTAIYRFPSASISFQGLTDLLNLEEGGGILAEVDTLIQNYRPERLADDPSYRTALNAKFYGGASFDLTKDHRVGAMLFSEIYQGSIIPAFSVFFNTRYNAVLDLAVNASVMNNRVDNVGIGLTARFLIFQWYLVTNNVFSYTNPISAQSINIRTGLNIHTGNIRKQKKGRRSASGDSIMLDI